MKLENGREQEGRNGREQEGRNEREQEGRNEEEQYQTLSTRRKYSWRKQKSWTELTRETTNESGDQSEAEKGR